MSRRSLRWRVWAVVAATCLVVTAATSIAVGGPTQWWTLGRSAEIFRAVPEPELAACDANPARWWFVSPTGLQAWALHPETLAPLNPRAPAVPRAIQLRLAAGEAQPVTLVFGQGTLVLRREGPCRLVVLQWPLDGTILSSFFGLVFAILSVGLLLTTVVGGWVVLRPLVRSIRELDRASRQVGQPGYAPAEVDVELVAVRSALNAAHERVLADRASLEQQQALLERHIADVAHDLRTPLAALQLRLERASTGDAEAVSGAMADVAYLGMLTENLAITGQLRQGLRAGEGSADAAAIATRVADRFAVLGRALGREVIAAVPDAPVWVQADALYVEQMLGNLVHNAVRHHDGRGTVVVVVEPGALGAAASPVVVEVCDDGPGDPDALPTTRADPGQTHGLGLSIVHTLAGHMGTHVEVLRNEPRGLVFRVRLPRGAPGGPPGSP